MMEDETMKKYVINKYERSFDYTLGKHCDEYKVAHKLTDEYNFDIFCEKVGEYKTEEEMKNVAMSLNSYIEFSHWAVWEARYYYYAMEVVTVDDEDGCQTDWDDIGSYNDLTFDDIVEAVRKNHGFGNCEDEDEEDE